jgi:hypothetical protein
VQSEETLLLRFHEPKLVEYKPLGKRPSEVKLTVIIRMMTFIHLINFKIC